MVTFKETMLKSVAAGVMIGIGGAVFLAQKNPLVGALFFTVGLFTIVEFGFFSLHRKGVLFATKR